MLTPVKFCINQEGRWDFFYSAEN